MIAVDRQVDLFCAIPQDVLAALPHLDGAPLRVLLALLFQLYRFRKDANQPQAMGAYAFTQATGLDRSTVWRAIKTLEALRVIQVQRQARGWPNRYAVNPPGGWLPQDVSSVIHATTLQPRGSRSGATSSSGVGATTTSGAHTTEVVAPAPPYVRSVRRQEEKKAESPQRLGETAAFKQAQEDISKLLSPAPAG